MSRRSRRRTAVASAVAAACMVAGAVIQVAGARGTGAAAPRAAPV
ncbi:MAG: hypothetical protein JWM18_1660, partial [Chloroflexi bacterium]|nr:hypothetical protein [Chloroflexota bacterium]